MQHADVQRIRIIAVRANDNGLPFSDITGESHSRRRSFKKKKRKKNTLRSPADIARFRLNKSPLSPIPNVRFFSLDRLYCVTCSIRDSESLCSLKWLAWVDCEFTRHFYYTFNNYLHRSPLFYTNCRLAWIFSRRGKIPIVCYNSIIESWAITVK